MSSRSRSSTRGCRLAVSAHVKFSFRASDGSLWVARGVKRGVGAPGSASRRHGFARARSLGRLPDRGPARSPASRQKSPPRPLGRRPWPARSGSELEPCRSCRHMTASRAPCRFRARPRRPNGSRVDFCRTGGARTGAGTSAAQGRAPRGDPVPCTGPSGRAHLYQAAGGRAAEDRARYAAMGGVAPNPPDRPVRPTGVPTEARRRIPSSPRPSVAFR